MEKTISGIAVNDIATTDEITFAPIATNFQIPLCKKAVMSEISEEFILPDYLPEIRRLLRVIPNIPIPSHYTGADISEFSGNIGWNILYVCGDGTLSEAYFSTPYEASVEIDDNSATEYVMFVDTVPESISAKVIAPRKTSIRARLSHNIKVYGDEVSKDIASETDDIKKLYKVIPSIKILSGTDNSVELVDSISVGENEKIVSKLGTVAIYEALPTDDGVVCKGNVCVKMIIQNKDSKAYSTEKNIPFTSYVPLETEGDAWKCSAYGKVDDIEIEETESTKDIKIRMTVLANAIRNQPSRITADIFSTKQVLAPVFKNISLPCSLCTDIFDFSHEGSLNIEGLPEGAEAIDVITTAKGENITLENGKYILSGKCKYNVLYGSDNEYSVRESEFPFSCELANGFEYPEDFMADISVRSAKVRSEGENIAFSSNLCASVNVIGITPITAVENISFEGEIPPRSSAFTVAYTFDGDSLWDIAKRYSVDPVSLANANGLKNLARIDDSTILSDVKYIII